MADPAQAALPLGEREIDVVRKETAELWKLSWPVVLSRLGIMAMGLTDAMVGGEYEKPRYGALGLPPKGVTTMGTAVPVPAGSVQTMPPGTAAVTGQDFWPTVTA